MFPGLLTHLCLLIILALWVLPWLFFFSQGKHGFCVNVYGDMSNFGESTGSHFNPFAKNHGAPEDDERHVGSLGNIEVDEAGSAKIHVEDHLVKLIGPQSVIGRSLVITQKEDDLGKGGHELSLIDGNSGPAAAVAIIGITD